MRKNRLVVESTVLSSNVFTRPSKKINKIRLRFLKKNYSILFTNSCNAKLHNCLIARCLLTRADVAAQNHLSHQCDQRGSYCQCIPCSRHAAAKCQQLGFWTGHPVVKRH